LDGLAIEEVFYGHLVYFTDIWYILRTFGIFCGHLAYFYSFGMLRREQSGNPALHPPHGPSRVTRSRPLTSLNRSPPGHSSTCRGPKIACKKCGQRKKEKELGEGQKRGLATK
jgi:hypothetical protein